MSITFKNQVAIRTGAGRLDRRACLAAAAGRASSRRPQLTRDAVGRDQ
jgi:hypothetical protein